MTQTIPPRFFVRCQNCKAAYVATLSRFTPWVCKKCGYDHGVVGTSLDYGEQMHNPATMPHFDLAAPRAEPAADPIAPGGAFRTRRRRQSEMILEGDGDNTAWLWVIGAAGLVFLLIQLGIL